MAEMNDVVEVWQNYLSTVPDWQKLVEGIEPKASTCGDVYEIPNPIARPNESFAIADMRQLELSEPHKHTGGETEIYIVIQGTGRIAVGSTVEELLPGSVIVTPPETIHITLPLADLVLAVINTPPFEFKNVVNVPETDPSAAEMISALRTAA